MNDGHRKVKQGCPGAVGTGAGLMEPNRIYYESMSWGSHFQPELQIGNGTSLRNGLKHPSYCYSAQSTFILQRKKGI